ncbi:MAG: hypothetical protein F6K26_43845 [Moorea sp. SIO2I5]|nr:hypothetical protein [Moorena sp. SIO2I5]
MVFSPDFQLDASPKSCLTQWCVTGRTFLTLATDKMRARPSLTHPTQLISSLLPTPCSLLPKNMYTLVN